MRIPSGCLILMSFFPHFLFASGFQLQLQGSRQLAMAHIGTGFALDATSIYFNPGALAHVKKSQIQVGGSLVAPYTAYLGPFPSVELTETETPVFTPIYFYASWKPASDSRLSLGLGVNNPFGYMIKWPNDWTGKLVVQEASFTSLFVQPTISYSLSKHISIGAGFVLGYSNFFMRRALPQSGQPNDQLSSLSMTTRGIGMGFNAGIFVQPNETFSFGISYRSSVNSNLDNGKLDFDVPSTFVDSFRATTFSTEIPLPGVLNVGIGYRPRETLLIGLDVNYTGWSIIDTLVFDFDTNSDLLEDRVSARNYKNVLAFRFGGEYLVNEAVALRLGAYYSASPVQEGFVSPEFPDADKIGFTGGLGLTNFLESLSLDVSLAFEMTGERTTFFEEAGLGGTYQTNIFTGSLGLSYTF